MNAVTIFVTIIITLLGVSYPILLQVISKLDEKYESDVIVEIFEKEMENQFFSYSLGISLIFILIWIFKFDPLIEIDSLNLFINNSAKILLGLSTLILVISFFCFISKILKYYRSSNLIPYLLKKHNKYQNKNLYFEALSDILLKSIRKKQKNYSFELLRFFYDSFKNERNGQRNQPIVYPDIFYETVYKIIEDLASQQEKRFYDIEDRSVGGKWLLGEDPGNEVSEKTYKWMWQNLSLIIERENDDLILTHWKYAHQYYSFYLSKIEPEYEYLGYVEKEKNENEIYKREEERTKFIDFHFALGGLIVSKQRYKLLNSIFKYTTQSPPKYELLPDSMDEIFASFVKFWDYYRNNFSKISFKYPFSGLYSQDADDSIKNWICYYIALLFLRQYNVSSNLFSKSNPIFPSVPKTQGRINEMIIIISTFENFINKILENKELLNTLHLEFLTKEWCINNERIYPLDFIAEFKNRLAEKYKDNAKTLPISQEKMDQFERKTNEIIENCISSIFKINNSKDIGTEDINKWIIVGIRTIVPKDGFTENPEIDFSHYDSFLANNLTQTIISGIAETFLRKRTKTYLFEPTDIFKAIDNLNISDKHLIVTFNFNLDRFIDYYKVKNLSKEKYKSTNIISYQGTRTGNNVIFVINKADLPKIITKQNEEEIKKFNYDLLNENINLYSALIDLNTVSEETLSELKSDKDNEELKKSVLMGIAILIEVRWKKDIELIQINEYSRYLNKGLPNKLSEVNTLD